MQVAIIGGGLGGMATAVRLAKLGHQVTLMEAADHLGGAVVRQDAGGPGHR
ncbi:MAG TPA: FAD-dependent oxidoreductase, partial [Marmoricola sp.]|nr:FAD-dependent oxidoreductase [Marmoricola sp.]